MRIEVVESRLKIHLTLHELMVARILKLPPFTTENSDLNSRAQSLFDATIGMAPPILGGDSCRWRAPSLSASSGAAGSSSADLSVIAVCTQAKMSPFSLDFPLPFLKDQSPAFQVAVQVLDPREGTRCAPEP